MTHVRGIASNLNERLQAQSEQAEREAFDFRFVTCVPTVQNVLDNPRPKVVVASLLGLETSFAQRLLQAWGAKEENLLLFVSPPPPGTLAHAIWSQRDATEFSYTVGARRRAHGRTGRRFR